MALRTRRWPVCLHYRYLTLSVMDFWRSIPPKDLSSSWENVFPVAFYTFPPRFSIPAVMIRYISVGHPNKAGAKSQLIYS